ncbi:hypothetical protein FOG51_01201 [Hanseniaspora uvarum]|nr:hypothetical protein FOG51_01201 [Hanseniaspora uvarum]
MATSTATETKTDNKIQESETYQVFTNTQGVHNIAVGNNEYRHKKPVFKTKEEEREHQLIHMAAACRYIAKINAIEGSAGHMTIKDPVDPSTIWITPIGIHWSQMKKSDMIHSKEDGSEILQDGNTTHNANIAGLTIHTALHGSRKNVNAAVHFHSIYGKAWSTFGLPLDMINQDVCIFYNCHTVYENFGGVVLEKEEGERLAKQLGDKNKAIILQNHGLLTVGETIDEAIYLFGLMERSCKIQLLVEQTNLPKKIISDEEAHYTFYNTSDPETLYAEFQPEYEVLEAEDDSFKN